MSGEERTRAAIKARRAEVRYWQRRMAATVEPSGNDTTPEITQAVAEDMDVRWDQ